MNLRYDMEQEKVKIERTQQIEDQKQRDADRANYQKVEELDRTGQVEKSKKKGGGAL